jgi:hypothetical protein
MNMADIFHEKRGEKQGQRRKRFLEFLRNHPKPAGQFDDKRKVWIREPKASGRA